MIVQLINGDILYYYQDYWVKVWPSQTLIYILILYLRNFALSQESSIEFLSIHTETSFNLGKLNEVWIVITLFRLLWNQTEFCLVPNQSENAEYNLMSLDLIRIRVLCICMKPHFIKHSQNDEIIWCLTWKFYFRINSITWKKFRTRWELDPELVKSNQNWNVITVSWLIENQTESRFMPNQSETGNCNTNMVQVNISFLKYKWKFLQKNLQHKFGFIKKKLRRKFRTLLRILMPIDKN